MFNWEKWTEEAYNLPDPIMEASRSLVLNPQRGEMRDIVAKPPALMQKGACHIDEPITWQIVHEEPFHIAREEHQRAVEERTKKRLQAIWTEMHKK